MTQPRTPKEGVLDCTALVAPARRSRKCHSPAPLKELPSRRLLRSRKCHSPRP